MASEQLSEREAQVLDHLQKAQELGSTLVEYSAAFALDVKELYAVKQQLVRKGVLSGRPRSEEPDKAGAFAPVRIVAPAPSPSAAAVLCRLVLPNGWIIESSSWPEPRWMAAVLAGGAHAAA